MSTSKLIMALVSAALLICGWLPGPAHGATPALPAESANWPTEQAPFPVRVIEDADAEKSKALALKHDEDDLDAQVRSATAAEGQVRIGWTMVVLTFLGSVALIVTLSVSKTASDAATAAALAARAAADYYQAAERAWVALQTIEDRPASGHDERGPFSGHRFFARWLNAGRTPAVSCTFCIAIAVIEADTTQPRTVPWFPPPPEFGDGSRSAVLAPGISASSTHQILRQADIERLKAGKCRVYFSGAASYKDIFHAATLRKSEFCVEILYSGEAFVPEAGEVRPVFNFSVEGPQNVST